MKILFFNILYFFPSAIGFAQQNNSDSLVFFSSLKTISLPLSEIEKKAPFKFKNVQILDNRTDTVRIGVFKNNFSKDCQLLLNCNLQDLFTSALKGRDGNDSLVIIIRNLFIINKFASIEDNSSELRVKKSSPGEDGTNDGAVIFNAKVYLQHSSFYIPLIKIDTFFVSRSSVDGCGSDLISQVLTCVSNATEEALRNKNYKRRMHLTRELFDSINKPIYASALRQPSADSGVYLSYDDFLQNKLTPMDYSLNRIDSGSFIIYEKQKDGTEIFNHTVWGLFDGKQTYIMSDGILFKLYKIGDAYYWNGFFRYKQLGIIIPLYAPLPGGFLYGYVKINTKKKLIHTPYLLNMLTGKAF